MSALAVRKVTPFKALAAVKLMETDGAPVLVSDKFAIFIGSAGAAMNFDVLEKEGITHILSLAGNVCQPCPKFTYNVHEVSDKPSSSKKLFDLLPSCMEFIDLALQHNDGKGKILVHCMMGKSRSATVITAYLMARQRLGMTEALDTVRERRPVAQPNIGFVLGLKRWEKKMQSVGRET
jgi:protein-tyrosine phosphatase